ncbi:hypothetical protein P7K49_006614 [Saguinus oedipus]|uniref:Uncharacterized protein n=1 Tax=Saguinus oedipus TaxID=9490 RepID=A0ABQ9W5B5_SAGOE|nr:hypothetical protein P7K49_006614 [Saguinus oedipus]
MQAMKSNRSLKKPASQLSPAPSGRREELSSWRQQLNPAAARLERGCGSRFHTKRHSPRSPHPRAREGTPSVASKPPEWGQAAFLAPPPQAAAPGGVRPPSRGPEPTPPARRLPSPWTPRSICLGPTSKDGEEGAKEQPAGLTEPEAGAAFWEPGA